MKETIENGKSPHDIPRGVSKMYWTFYKQDLAQNSVYA